MPADRDEIVAFDPTNKEVHDASRLGPLPEQVANAPASCIGDGAYDRPHVLDAVRAKNPAVGVIVSPGKGAMLGSTATTAPTQRICPFVRSTNMGMDWRTTSGYYRGSKGEGAIGRSKHVIGDALRHVAMPVARVR